MASTVEGAAGCKAKLVEFNEFLTVEQRKGSQSEFAVDLHRKVTHPDGLIRNNANTPFAGISKLNRPKPVEQVFFWALAVSAMLAAPHDDLICVAALAINGLHKVNSTTWTAHGLTDISPTRMDCPRLNGHHSAAF